MTTLNLGILAHVDAGKTTLTERLLFAAGVIEEIGSVDKGSTQTDSLALERQRGITIKSAVVSFKVDDVTVNLIDTPGHPDFIAEVERVLNVLDGAVLVLSAVEGVQAQTRVLMRTLQRLRIPTLLFVNKVDRFGADCDRVLASITGRLTPAIVAMGSVHDPGTRVASFTPFGPNDPAFLTRLAELLAERDDTVLAAYVDADMTVSYHELRARLAAQVGKALVHPVFLGSAITGAGLEPLTAGITNLLPAAQGDPAAPVSGRVFKVERGPAGEKIAYARLFSGTIRNRDRVKFGTAREGKVTGISLFEHGSTHQSSAVAAGQIAKIWGLDARVGDTLGETLHAAEGHHFAPPTLESVVVPSDPAGRGPLYAALTQLAEQDPLINVRQDDSRQEISVSLYGEVQKEVIQATLATEFGLAVDFRETTAVCVERPIGTGEAAEFKRQGPNPFLATVGLRVEPGLPGSGVEFRLATEVLGTMPHAFYAAVEDTVHRTLREGIHGWQVTDCLVTMTHSGYFPRQSHAHQGFSKSMSSTGEDFRNLTPLVLMAALQRAGTRVYEPIDRFDLEIPADALGPALPALAKLGAVAGSQELHGSVYHVQGQIPVARVHEFRQQLPALTRGEGVLECAFDSYQPVRGAPPTRPRSDHNPLNRKEYLLHVQRRV